MPVKPGTVSISSPTGGDVPVGLLGVTGQATSGLFIKPDGTFTAQLPPSSVTLRVDGGTSHLATQRAAHWQQWETFVDVGTPGPHSIVATARRATVWTATDNITVNAVAPRMRIDGVEQTQAIQFFDYEHQGSGAGADNSLPLVAQKATMLRVYVADILQPPGPIRVSGELAVGFTSLLPSNGPIRLRDADKIDRGEYDHTLNFLLPPNMCVGTLSCTLRIFDPNRPGPRFYEDEETFTVTFLPTPRLRIYGVLIHYTRAGANLPAPTSTAFTETLDTSARVGPTSQINYTGFSVVPFDGDLVAPAVLGCGPGWDDLIAMLRTMRTASATSELYVALLPTGVPISTRGCGSSGVAAGRDRDAFVMMHEVGHALGRQHAPCPATIGNQDPAYPTYTNPNTNRPPHPAGTIGEYGFNLATDAILTPQDTFDVMSACFPLWISPYTWLSMRNAIVTTQPFSLMSDGAGGSSEFAENDQVAENDEVKQAAELREYLHLIVRVHQSGDVEVVSAFHLPGPEPAPDRGAVSGVTCELVGANGEVIESKRLYEELLQRPGGPYTQYFGTVPWEPSVEAIVLTRHGNELYTRRVAETAPQVRLNTPEFAQDNMSEQVHLGWAGDAPGEEPVAYILRYSNDDGETWRAVGPPQAETSYMVDLAALAGGERCRFQVVASADVKTSVNTSDPFTIPVKPMSPEVLAPVDGTAVREGERVLLHGRAFSPDFGTCASEEMLWFSDKDGLVGVGHETWTPALSEGLHSVSLRVPDGLGGESEQVVTVEVRPAT